MLHDVYFSTMKCRYLMINNKSTNFAANLVNLFLHCRLVSCCRVIKNVNKAINNMMDFNENVESIMSVNDSASVKHHIEITVRVSARSDVEQVDYHTFYLPYDAKASDIKANRIQ